MNRWGSAGVISDSSTKVLMNAWPTLEFARDRQVSVIATQASIALECQDLIPVMVCPKYRQLMFNVRQVREFTVVAMHSFIQTLQIDLKSVQNWLSIC